jgi:hypothetical protein
MDNQVEHNALLLQVMAHDLLAPLTAVKWQVELLNRDNIPPAKKASYIQGITDSTALGIALTKHAHVAGRVLVGTYDKNDESISLPEAVRAAVHSLRLQYERHGLDILAEVGDELEERVLDRELTALMIWSVAKFFLTCTPAGSTVSMRGLSGSSSGDNSIYTLIVSAPNVPDMQELARCFRETIARDPYDQAYVFTKLIHTSASLLNASVHVETQADLFAIEIVFGTGSTNS